MTDNVDRKLQNYWSALRGLRRTETEEQRAEFLKGHFTLTVFVEKDPRLKSRLQNVLADEIAGRQSRPFS